MQVVAVIQFTLTRKDKTAVAQRERAFTHALKSTTLIAENETFASEINYASLSSPML